MSTDFPTSADSYSTKVDGVDDVEAAHINDIQDAIEAIETEILDEMLNIKNKIDATTAPTVNEDTGDGYSAGSLWVDVTNDKAYVCLDASAGAAIWQEIGSEESSGFSATLSGDQTISSGVETKVSFDTEDFDIAGDYDAASNYRHTPSIAGKYTYHMNIIFWDNTAGKYFEIFFKKNGAAIKDNWVWGDGNTDTSVSVSVTVAMNGSTDYVEVYVKQNVGSDVDIRSGTRSWFDGHLASRN